VRKICLLLIGLIFVNIALSQNTGTIVGKILDKSNNPIIGVTITVNGVTNKAKTDVEGRYSITISVGTHTILFTSVGYAPKTINTIEVKANTTTDLDIMLDTKKSSETDIIVKGTPNGGRKETVNAGIQFQKNTNTVASIITAESIKRSPDKTTGEVLKRTPGASIQEGKFLVIRGLADRYNQAMLNGILLTSTEPDRKTFSFDIIPSAMVDNLVINKAFVPEYPGEWAGGLIQVNTKDIPNKNFFNIQVGSGFNTQTIGRTFYQDKGGKTDWLGIDDGTRSLPNGYTTKSGFDTTGISSKTAIGKTMRNAWTPTAITAPLNASFQINGGFTGKLFGKKVGGIIGLNYNKNNKYLELLNRINTLSGTTFSINSNLDDDRYQQDVQLGALASFTIQLNNANKISIKTITNVNTSNQTTLRNGYDVVRGEDLQGTEFTFRQNTFFTTQLNGDHSISKNVRLKWYGAFNILDGYTPDQRRILYTRAIGTNNPYNLLIGSTLSQQSASRIFQFLNDYIYTGGGDVTYTLKNKQTIKAGYMLQIRDRLFDAKLFANFLNTDNPTLRSLPSDKVFAPENFGNGTDNKFGFSAIKGNTFRYMANTILNAGYIQIDNELFNKLRVVWGVRVEHFDQLVGSVKTWDPRYTYSKVLDVLPGLNATYKVNAKTNIRFSASQTVIRPELRELASLNLYDFELNASIQGNPLLKRTKVTNLDLRYEFYNKPGEVFTAGLFYKNFKDPIEQLFNEGAGGASTFNYQNPESAYSTGIEIEFRKKLDFTPALKNFTFQSNAAFIKSKIKDTKFNVDRPLQGQSPYLVNVGLLYDVEKYGISSTLLFNVVGERIFLVGDISAGAGSPNIYEAPRPILDYQITKKILKKKAELRMNVSDILNRKQYFYQNSGGKNSFQKNEDAYRFTRRFGTTFNFTFSYTL
jgi:TonB-dependent receptor